LLSQPGLEGLSGMAGSDLRLVALGGVVVGVGGDPRSLAGLVWAAPTGDEEKVLFEYFISLGLREYHEGLATELQHLAQRSAEEARATVETERLKIFSHEVPDIERTAAFLDRFEDRFYQSWREAIERKERQN